MSNWSICFLRPIPNFQFVEDKIPLWIKPYPAAPVRRGVTVKEVSQVSLPQPLLSIYLYWLHGHQLAPLACGRQYEDSTRWMLLTLYHVSSLQTPGRGLRSIY